MQDRFVATRPATAPKLSAAHGRPSFLESRQDRLWLLPVPITIGLFIAYVLAPPGYVAAVIFSGTQLFFAATIGWGIHRNRPSGAAGWWAMSVGVTLVAAATGLWVGEPEHGLTGSGASIADAFDLTGDLLIVVGLAVVMERALGGGARASLVDASILTIGAFLLAWTFWMDPLIKAGAGSQTGLLVALAHPAVDVLWFGLVARLLLARGQRTPAFWLLAAALPCAFVGDMVFAMAQANQGFEAGAFSDLGWWMFTAGFAMAALHPSMVEPIRSAQQASDRPTTVRLLLLLAALVLVPAVVALEVTTGANDPEILEFAAVAGVAMAVLVVGRLGMTVVALRDSLDVSQSTQLGLERSQALLGAAEAIGNVGSWEMDLGTWSVRWSDHMYRILDVPRDRTLDFEAFLAVVHPDDRDRVASATQESIRDRSEVAIEYRTARSDGTERTVSAQSVVVSDDAGTPIRMYGTARDVTDSRRLENEYRQAQKMEAVGRLAGGIAHDFNNALTAILGYSQLLGKSLTGRREAEWVNQVEGAARYAARLTSQLLAFSRRQVLQTEVLDIGTLVSGFGSLLRRLIGEDIELVTRVEPGLGYVRADPGQLQQVIMNLVVNARDAMPDGGRLEVTCGNSRLDADGAAAVGIVPGDYVCLQVSDTGHGMDEGTKARIFEPFYTTKEVDQGTGLGLAMVHGFVIQSGGNITCETESGVGTTFRILLPRLGGDESPIAQVDEVAESVLPMGSGRILLVEDDPVVRQLARLYLAQQGYSVTEAEDGEQALAELERSSTDIDLVISDVIMPKVGGRILAEAMRSRNLTIPLIFISGYPGDPAVASASDLSGIPLLSKPFTPSQLVTLVQRTMASQVDGPPVGQLADGTVPLGAGTT